MLNSTENCFRNIVAMRSVSYTNCFAMSLYLIDYLLDAKTVFVFKEEPYYCYYACIKEELAIVWYIF